MARQKQVVEESIVDEIDLEVQEPVEIEVSAITSFKNEGTKNQLVELSSLMNKEIPVLQEQILSDEFRGLDETEKNYMRSQLHFMTFLLESVNGRLSFL